MSEELKLYLKNEKRKRRIMKNIKKEYYLVKIIKEWKNWWFKLNETYVVRKYSYKSTKDGITDFCMCKECKELRKDKKMYDMYEVVLADESIIDPSIKIGSIIPIKVCKVRKNL